MTHLDQQWDGKKLLRDGWPDEAVERFTGLSLSTILLLRAEVAAASFLEFQRQAELDRGRRRPHP